MIFLWIGFVFQESQTVRHARRVESVGVPQPSEAKTFFGQDAVYERLRIICRQCGAAKSKTARKASGPLCMHSAAFRDSSW
jgi:hypothetical protein